MILGDQSGCHLRNISLTAALAAALLLAAPGLAAAQDSDQDSSEDSGGVKWTIGAGVGLAPDYEGSDDYEPVPIPAVRAAWGEGYFVDLGGSSLGALQLRGNVIPSRRFQAGPLGNFRRERDDVDNDRVDDLNDVDHAFELGAFVGYLHPLDALDGAKVGVNFQFAGDVSGSHDGFLFQPGVDFTMPFAGSFRLNTRGYTTYATEKYMSTYFGIDAGDSARSGLSRFNADAGFKDVGLGLGVDYMITDAWSVGVLGSYVRLLGDAEDSPVTDDEGSANQFFAGVLVKFTF